MTINHHDSTTRIVTSTLTLVLTLVLTRGLAFGQADPPTYHVTFLGPDIEEVFAAMAEG